MASMPPDAPDIRTGGACTRLATAPTLHPGGKNPTPHSGRPHSCARSRYSRHLPFSTFASPSLACASLPHWGHFGSDPFSQSTAQLFAAISPSSFARIRPICSSNSASYLSHRCLGVIPSPSSSLPPLPFPLLLSFPPPTPIAPPTILSLLQNYDTHPSTVSGSSLQKRAMILEGKMSTHFR